MRTLEMVWAGASFCAALAGCGGSVTTASGGAGSTDTNGGGGTGGTTTTSNGGATTGTGGTMTTSSGGTGGTTIGTGGGVTLAVHKLLFGDTTPNGTPSSVAWKQYGYNIDGKISTGNAVDLCKPSAGANPSTVFGDGDNGIDNSFGKNTLPILLSLTPDFATEANDAIVSGRFSLIFHIQDLGPGQTGTFPAALYGGRYPANVAPAWQGMDAWPIRSDWLVNGDLSSPKVLFPMSSVSADAAGTRVWQSVGVADVDLVVHLLAVPFVLPIKNARIEMTLSADNAHAVSGRLGGMLDTAGLIAELAKVAGSFDPALCPPSSTFEAIAQQTQQGQDILLDGSQDPSKTCNAISIGLGFEADAALLGAVVPPSASPDPCSP